METKVLEGTFAEVQRQLSDLPYAPEERVRIVIMEPEALETVSIEPYKATEFRNGVPLLPHRALTKPVTQEDVERLLDEEDEELLRAYRATGH